MAGSSGFKAKKDVTHGVRCRCIFRLILHAWDRAIFSNEIKIILNTECTCGRCDISAGVMSNASAPEFRPCQHIVSIGRSAAIAAQVLGALSHNSLAIAVLPFCSMWNRMPSGRTQSTVDAITICALNGSKACLSLGFKSLAMYQSASLMQANTPSNYVYE